MTDKAGLARLMSMIPALAGKRVLVVGDLVADRYILASPSRLSREAPVVIAKYEGEDLIPGGAANTVNNLLALGAEVLPVGVLGCDEQGTALREHFSAIGVDTAGMVAHENWTTITKTRVMVGDPNRMKQQVLRLDRDPPEALPSSAIELMSAKLREWISSVDAILLSDYGYGLVSPSMLKLVLDHAGSKVVTADSRYRIVEFSGVTFATPNEGEVEEALGFPIRNLTDLDRAGQILMERINAPALLITRGNQGMALFRRGEARVDIAASGSLEVTDVSGAGDTVIAVATLARAAGASYEDAARLANAAAGVTVMKLGAATCSPLELQAAIEQTP